MPRTKDKLDAVHVVEFKTITSDELYKTFPLITIHITVINNKK